LTIFVSIASYRDPELIPTIRDCLANAKYPNDLRLGVCWQHGPEETADPILDDARINVLDVNWRDSKGVCWARAEIMRLLSDEDYYLQLDSHHRFVPGWDAKLIEQFALAPSSKPVLTTYCQGYDPDSGNPLCDLPTKMVLDSFTPDGIPLFRALSVALDSRTPARPLRSRFVSAHFLFASSTFINEVEYDPSLYFYGEEISLAVRAYTCGYDLFHPAEAILFHQYSRNGRPRHWSDHSDEAEVELSWQERDRYSRARVIALLKNRYVGRFSFGTTRTVDEYEAYAGIDFVRQIAQEPTILGDEPPNRTNAPWQERRVVTIELDRHHLQAFAFANMIWRVSVYDFADVLIHMVDLQREVVNDILLDTSPMVLLRLTITSHRLPTSWQISCLGIDGDSIDTIRGSVRLRN
jgi:Glycosyltransferase (GlcNAc)